MWSESKDGAGKERRRGWNKQRRCGDLLRKKQMLCFIYILYWEKEQKDELESAPPLQHTAIKAVQKEENDWQTTMSGSGFVGLSGPHAHTWTFKQHTLLAEITRFASLRLLTSMFCSSSEVLVVSVCHSVLVSPFFLLKFHHITIFFFFCPRLLGPATWHISRRPKLAGVFFPNHMSPRLSRCEVPVFSLCVSERDNKTGLRRDGGWV